MEEGRADSDINSIFWFLFYFWFGLGTFLTHIYVLQTVKKYYIWTLLFNRNITFRARSLLCFEWNTVTGFCCHPGWGSLLLCGVSWVIWMLAYLWWWQKPSASIKVHISQQERVAWERELQYKLTMAAPVFFIFIAPSRCQPQQSLCPLWHPVVAALHCMKEKQGGGWAAAAWD